MSRVCAVETDLMRYEAEQDDIYRKERAWAQRCEHEREAARRSLMANGAYIADALDAVCNVPMDNPAFLPALAERDDAEIGRIIRLAILAKLEADLMDLAIDYEGQSPRQFADWWRQVEQKERARV